jgi:phage protein D
VTGEAISWTLELGGSAAPPELVGAVQTIEVEDHAELADMLRLTVGVGVSQSSDDWTFLTADRFPRLGEAKVSVTIGSGDGVPLIDARIIETATALSHAPNESALTVVAMDPTVLLNLEEKVKAWPDMADSGIAQAIFGDHGFDAEVETTEPTRQEDDVTTIQRGTDMQLLQRLATRNGYELFVEPTASGPKWHFHPPRLDQQPQGVLSVGMGEATNVNSFRVRHDMLRPATAAATSLDVEGREDQSGEAQSASLQPLGAQAASAADQPRHVLLTGTGLTDGGELAAYAQAVVDRSSWALRADVELNTIAYGGVVRAKKPIQVRGAGQLLSGTWYVERVVHTITGEGYVQRVRLRRNATGVQAGESFSQSRAAA